MQYVILTFLIILFSPIAIANTNTTTVFSWLDADGIMHFADEKPQTISDDTITISDVAEPSELGTPVIKVPALNDSDIETDDLQVPELPDVDNNTVALNVDESTDLTVILSKAVNNDDDELQ